MIYTSSVQDATRALYENRKVELKQPKKVSTLLDHLRQVTKHMIEMGKEAPVFNLCNVSVAGTNLFCVTTKGIPRVMMPQMDEDQTKAFRKYLEDQGHKVEKEEESASFMRATQNELNGAKVAEIAHQLRKHPDQKQKRLLISRDDYIVDGHHHWAAVIGIDAQDNKLGDQKMKVARIDMDIISLLVEADKFTGGKGRKSAKEMT